VKEERILVVVPQLNLDGASRPIGDLVFTTRQIFLARTAGNADLARAFDTTKPSTAAQRSRSASQHLRAQPLDTILARADRHTRFTYRELQGITVKLGGLFSSPAVRVIPRHGKSVKLLGKWAALEHLASKVPFLVDAGVPISLS
jgi:hypothetical protein